MAFAQFRLTNANSRIFLADSSAIITALYLANTSAGAVTVSVYLVPPSGTAGLSTVLYHTITVNPAQTLAVLTERVPVETGDSIWAVCSSVDAVTATVCSVAV